MITMLLVSLTSIDVQLPIVISNDVWLGSDVTVLKGVSIGSGAVVAVRCYQKYSPL